MAVRVGTAASCAERATSDTLTGPDWGINIELCDILNSNPGETKDVMKILKKRLASKSSEHQLLALFLLDSLTKNCGDYIYVQIVKRDVLHQMVKIVKKKPDLNVSKKILSLLDTWQYVLGGSKGRHPPYYAAYKKLLSAGIKFPPREEENAASHFTISERSPAVNSAVAGDEDAAIQASLQDISSLSYTDIKSAREITDVLLEMLSALQPNDQEGAKEEVITDLVEECQSYQRRVINLIDNASDEELLHQCLSLNDELQRVLQRYDSIIKGDSSIRTEERVVPSAPPIFDPHHEDDPLEYDFTHFRSRTSIDSASRHSPTSPTDQQVYTSPFVPPLPSLSKLSISDEGLVDYKCSEANKLATHYDPYVNKPPVSTEWHSFPSLEHSSVPLPASSDNEHSSVPLPASSDQPKYDESVQNGNNPIEQFPRWNSQSPILLPPPPSKHNQRQQFFDQQQQQHKEQGKSSLTGQAGDLSLNHGNSSFSHQPVVRSMHGGNSISANSNHRDLVEIQDSSPAARAAKPQDSLFQDLVDLAKARTRR